MNRSFEPAIDRCAEDADASEIRMCAIIYSFLSFDNFCRLKEYPNEILKGLNIPSWK